VSRRAATVGGWGARLIGGTVDTIPLVVVTGIAAIGPAAAAASSNVGAMGDPTTRVSPRPSSDQLHVLIVGVVKSFLIGTGCRKANRLHAPTSRKSGWATS